jgi:glycosyltransferase involved in cell wall biosynthesis
MKILQVTPAFVPSSFGGVKTVSYNLSRALAGKGYEVTVFTTDADLGRRRLRNVRNIRRLEGLNIRYFGNASNLLAVRYRLFLPLGMACTARKEVANFDIIHLHEYRTLQNITIHHYAVQHRIPYVIDTHGSLPRLHGGRGPGWLFRWLFDATFGKRILHDAARVIAVTNLGVKEYRDFHIGQDKIALMPPPFPTDEFSELPPRGLFRQKYSLEGRPVIMFLGRLHWIKGLDFLIKAFAELTEVNSEARLVVVGPDDGYRPALEGLIQGLGIADRVLFTGYLGGAEKLSALVDADVVVQTSKYEYTARTPFEAVLCGTPVIVSRNTGSGADVQRLDAGYLVEYGNLPELSNMIQYVLSHPEEARARAQKAKDYIKANLSLAASADRYLKLYAEVAEGAKR